MELIEKRTRNSKTHYLGGRKYAWDGTIGSIHYKDEAEQWQEIDNIFEPAVAPWDWEMLKAGYHIRVKEDFTAGQIIEFEKQGETVQFQPMALEWTNDLDQIQQVSMPQDVTPVITNPEVDLLPAMGVPSHQGTIKWNDAYGEGIDFEWRCTSTRLVKILEIENLNKLPVPEQYILDGGNPVLRLNLTFDPPSKQDVDIYVDGELWDRKGKKQTFKVIEFRKDGEVLWGFMPLRYWGSSPELEEENEGQSIATLEKRGNKLYISIRVPYEWLQSAVYPVFIDITVDEQVGASTDDCYTYAVYDWWDIDYSHILIGNGSTGTDYRCKAGMRFQTVDIAQGATINVAYLTFESSFLNAGTTVNLNVYCEAVDDAPTFADDRAAFLARTRTEEFATWDNVEGWSDNTTYNSDSIVTPIQAVISRGGWVANYDLVVFVEDDDSSDSAKRRADSWDGVSADAPKLHIEYTSGVTNYPISLSPGLTVSATVAYAVAWDRGMSPGLTASITIARSLGRLITTTANLTVSSTVARAMAYAKAITSNLTVSTTVVKSWGRTITTTANLVVSITLTRLRNRTIVTSPGLTTSATVDRDLAYGRATSPGLVVSATTAVSKGFVRAITSNLTISATVVRIAGRVITTSAGLTVNVVISRVLTYHRVISSGLLVSVSIVKSMFEWVIKILTKPFRSDLIISSNLTKDVTITSTLTADLGIASELGGELEITSELKEELKITPKIKGG